MSKKLISFMLVIVISLTGICCKNVSAASKVINDELKRIKTYKLFSNTVFKNPDEPMTDSEFYSAIKNFIKPYGEKALKKFDSEIASSLKDGNPLTYQDVFILTYLAAYATDTAKLTQTYSNTYIYNLVEEERYWYQKFKCNEKYTDEGKGKYVSYEPYGGVTRFASPDDILAESIFFVLLQTSQWSGAALYDVKNDTNLKMFSANCPNDIAVRMLGRLYETTIPVEWSKKNSNYKNIDKESQIKKENILNSKSEYPTGGNIYYVSTSGDDDNDGKSEETPWRSLQVASGKLEPGSVVLLKRGDIWKGESLRCQPGVTYSAYGEGEKPAIYGDTEDAGNPDNWILCKDLSNRNKKIWKYRNEVYDLGGIIFNEGESYATRIYGWWKDSKWVDFYDVKKELTPSYALKENLTFISLPDCTGLDYPVLLRNANPRKGPVYLRCDKGNPAELYDEINFELSSGDIGYPIECYENSTVDNIAVKYFGELGICAVNDDQVGMSLEGITVRNCEVGFGGNIHLCFNSEKPEEFSFTTGDGIYCICNGAIIKNNYIHDIDCNGVRVENSADFYNGGFPDLKIDKPMLIEGNLIARNGGGIWLETVGGNVSYKNITIKDNMILENGKGWVHSGGCGFVSISTDIAANRECSDIVIKDNVVYDTDYAIYDCSGKGIKASKNRFYMCSYSSDTVSKNGVIFVVNRKTKNASVIGSAESGKNTINIPEKIKVGKISYAVTKISSHAFENDENIKNITIKSKKIKSIGKNAFAKLSSKTVVQVPADVKKAYTDLLKNAGFSGNIK